MALPSFNTPDRILSMLQSSWASLLNPLLANPVTKGVTLTKINLINGSTVVNHLLDRQMQGWIITDISAPATVYRSQPLNNKTLTLTSNAATTVSLWVY